MNDSNELPHLSDRAEAAEQQVKEQQLCETIRLVFKCLRDRVEVIREASINPNRPRGFDIGWQLGRLRDDVENTAFALMREAKADRDHAREERDTIEQQAQTAYREFKVETGKLNADLKAAREERDTLQEQVKDFEKGRNGTISRATLLQEHADRLEVERDHFKAAADSAREELHEWKAANLLARDVINRVEAGDLSTPDCYARRNAAEVFAYELWRLLKRGHEAREELATLKDLVLRLRQWDMFNPPCGEVCADAPYWVREIDKALAPLVPASNLPPEQMTAHGGVVNGVDSPVRRCGCNAVGWCEQHLPAIYRGVSFHALPTSAGNQQPSGLRGDPDANSGQIAPTRDKESESESCDLPLPSSTREKDAAQ